LGSPQPPLTTETAVTSRTDNRTRAHAHLIHLFSRAGSAALTGATRRTLLAIILLATASGLSAHGGHGQPCNCNPGSADAQVVEWDIPSPLDFRSGAITLDVHSSHTGRLWFVSRVGDVKLYRLDPGKPITTKNAKWKSWDLNPLSLTTGGLYRIKVHKNDTDVFVRTHTSLQRISTNDCSGAPLMETCDRITWLDQLADGDMPDAVPHVSDLSTDDCHVYTTAAVFADPLALLPLADKSYVQQLSPCNSAWTSSTTGTTKVKRWKVGGSAGFCAFEPVPGQSPDSSPCISGVAVDPRKNHLVYFAQPGDSKIGELNVQTNNVRRWSLSRLGTDVFEPRQIDVDDDGTVWTVTASGHLVRLDPKKNRMSKHLMPAGQQADPFGVAPDHGVIGYTNSAQDQNKVAMLFPKGNTVYVAPTTECITPKLVDVAFVKERAATSSAQTPPMVDTVHAQITDKGDGLFVEAPLGELGSMVPLGITPDLSKKVGTYFYAVGFNAETGFNRVGQIVLPTKNRKHNDGRDDDDHDRDGKRDDHDDDDDDDGKKDWEDNDNDNDCVNDVDDWDDDNDGIKDEDDRKDRRETRHTRSDEVEGGSAAEHEMEVDGSNLLLAASATSLNPGALLGIEVYNPSGVLVASPLPTPGVAAVSVPTLQPGIYKIRVKNLGLSQIETATEILTQAQWPLGWIVDLLP
jgi:streptogramin lyase